MGQVSSIAICAVLAFAAHFMPASADEEIPTNPVRDLYFGETHMHTSYSLDAFIGGTHQTPDDAYRAARGHSVVVNGKPHKIRRPLDFAAVTDHAEYMGEMYSALNDDAQGHDNPQIQQLLRLKSIKERESWFVKYVVSVNRSATPQHPPFYPGEAMVKSAWKVAIEAAERHYVPGAFTTLIGFEWSAAPQGANLHRNVLFRDAKVPDIPASYITINREEGLWTWLRGLEEQGMRPLALPHNSNASKGLMFPEKNSKGGAIDGDYAELREHFERGIEVMQVKGNSEVHRKFWAADEFSNFENADSMGNFNDRVAQKQNFIRYGVVRGMKYQQALGTNPFKLGFVGGTDSHNGMMSDVDEDNFVGAHGPEDGSIKARREGSVTSWLKSKDLSVGSITGVWATSNTRGAIWDAIHGRETFATSGPRMAVRFFGGWKYGEDLNTHSDFVERAYADGVPMGGDLPDRPRDKSPRFLLAASKDALGANLDRIQIIKGWVDENGELHDKVFEAVWAGARKPDTDGKLPPIGNTVDLATATYLNTIGSAQLSTVWEDPEFNPDHHALYYVRVIEIPTPRWSTYDAVRAGLPLLKDVAATIQERAWSSPIWYTP